MLVITWRELLGSRERFLQTEDHVYDILDGEGEVIYIGKSRLAERRLKEHVGEGIGAASQIGKFIIRGQPESFDWKINIYEPCDYEPMRQNVFEALRIQEHAPEFNNQHVPRSYQRAV